MYSNDIAIRVTNLSKRYEIYDAPRDRLKQFVLPRLRRIVGGEGKHYFREFWALRDVSFEIKKGETVGIIGRNGSGKSTLLQMICGTLSPSSGSVETSGRIAALLELGSGFNPEFTGRENVFMNATVLGLSREQIEARFDSIANFAEIGQFIDQPVKNYSSGMYVRLAFSVIAHVDADILVIDEALSVGDIFFQQKCMRFIRKFQEEGGTILFVSHDTATVLNICQRAVMLSPNGQKSAVTGSAESVCKLYLSDHYSAAKANQEFEKKSSRVAEPFLVAPEKPVATFTAKHQEKNIFIASSFRNDADSFGEGGVTIVDAGFFGATDERLVNIVGGDATRFVVRIKVNQRICYPAVGLMIKDRLGQFLYTEGTDAVFRQHHLVLEAGALIEAAFHFRMPILIRGKYTINVAVAEGIGDDHVQHHWIHDAVSLESISGPVVHGIGGLSEMEMIIQFVESSREIIA